MFLAVVGFGFGGWQTAAKSDALAGLRANTAVAKALAPVCAEPSGGTSISPASGRLKKADEWRVRLIETAAGNCLVRQTLIPRPPALVQPNWSPARQTAKLRCSKTMERRATGVP